MKKKIILLIFLLNCFILGNSNCLAASATIKSSLASVTKGNKITITVTVSADSPLVSIEGTLKCSGTGVNGGLDLRFDDSSNSIYSKTYTYSVTPSSAGTLLCYTEGVRLTEMSKDTWQNVSDKKVNVTVNNPSVIAPKEYSSNNYLSSLSIEGYDLDKTFDKEVLEYNVELPNGTEKVNINAKVENSNAKVSGTGEIEVTEGVNKISLKVTAENGNVKTYVVNAIVKELDPIYIKLDNKQYTIVRKEDVLEPLEGYTKTVVKINDEEVLAYYNEITKYTLVILKGEDGNCNYYVYDNNKYTLYKEYNFSGIRLHLLDSKKPDNYVEKELTIGEDKVIAYQIDINKKNTTYALDSKNINNYYLVYGMNINTGNKSYYLIDKLENTTIRYDEELSLMFLDNKIANNYKSYFFITLAVIGIMIIVFGISLIISGKKKRHKLNFK